ncbi:MAG: FG-GAP repeat domain-containing protein [Myxococcota bacterium]
MKRSFMFMLLFAAAHEAPAQTSSGFAAQRLEVPGSLRWVVYGDVDGDGAVDLVVSYRRGGGPKAQRFLAVFFRGTDGFSRRPDLAFQAIPVAAAFDLGDVDGKPGQELLSWTADGVYAQSLKGRRVSQPYRIIEMQTLLGSAEDEDLVHWNMLRPFGPGGMNVIILPGRGRLHIFKKEGPLWKIWADLKFPNQSFYEPESETFRPTDDGGGFGSYSFRALTIVPKLSLVEQSGDGRIDIVAAFEDQVAVYVQEAAGGFKDEPDVQRYFQLRTEEELETGEAFVQSQVMDLNGDNIADLSLRKNTGGIRDAQSTIQLFLGQRGGGFSETPAQVIERKGVASLVGFEDVDGDGTIELLLPRLEISLFSIIGVFTSGKIAIDVDIFPRDLGGSDLFSLKPKQTLTVRLGIDFDDGGSVQGGAPILGHDFDGDGRRDIILSDGGDRMLMHRGLEAGNDNYFQRSGYIELVGPGSPTTLALPTGSPDGLPDVLTYFVSRRKHAGQLLLQQNRYEAPSAAP